MELGLRVVRGPHWRWDNQDSGEGHVGTVVEIGRPGNNSTPDKTVVVQWDSGFRTNYRVGYQGAFDLRVFDNAPAGVKHPNIICDSCKKQGIQGMRWKCAKCYDFDLCHQCYMGDKHDLNHAFLRFENPNMCRGVKVSKRSNSSKLQCKGIFAGAKVVRGPDWDWGNQDGGEMQPGRVEDIRGWDNESGRSVANVFWLSSGSTNVYRLGHKGKVDIKYTEEGLGTNFYRDHLPVLGETPDSSPAKDTHSMFKVGDKVKVDLHVDVLKSMQEGHGGWNPRMAEYIGRVGTVHRITERGDVRVQYEGCANRWTFHTGALTRVHTYSVGDYVKISSDLQMVKKLQAGHGDWRDDMKVLLGKTGTITKVYTDGDLRVNVSGTNWTLNPKCVSVVPHGQEDANNTLDRHADREHHRRQHTDPSSSILHELLEPRPGPSTEVTVSSPGEEEPSSSDTTPGPSPSSPASQSGPDPDRLVREAAQGHLDTVRQIVAKYPDRIDCRSSGKTGLQVACHQGHADIVRLLLSAGADMHQRDDDGDTALHYSVFGDQPEIAELLLESGAQVDVVNKGGCSSLHVAVNKQHLHCVGVLLRYKAQVNIQDAYGDTPLHDAMGKDSGPIIDLLVAQQGVNFMLKNKRGFNVLHHAALKGNPQATEKIINQSRQTVDSKKDDGFAALHLACLNGHLQVADTLITTGRADLEIRNNRRQTPLLLAVSQGHAPVVQLLVNKGCNLGAVDENGDSCLHLALMRQTMPCNDLELAPDIAQIVCELEGLELDNKVGVAVTCYLTDRGADLMRLHNNQGKTPLDTVTDPRLSQILQRYAHKKTSCIAATPAAAVTPSGPPPTECLVCSDTLVCVVFEPCGHSIVCEQCCVRMKKCVKCQQLIERKVTPAGAVSVAGGSQTQPQLNEREMLALRELERRLQEMEDTHNCGICLERPRKVAFLCGHSACSQCAHSLAVCHMCRKPIKQKIDLY